jgi:hypothetical protein
LARLFLRLWCFAAEARRVHCGALMGRRPALCLLALLPLALFAGCLSPTLPLPPPDKPDSVSPVADATGVWTISGDCIAGALVTVFNERTGEGAVVEDRDHDGRYEAQITAELCDVAWVSQQIVEEEESSRTTFVIQELTPSGPKDPNACK